MVAIDPDCLPGNPFSAVQNKAWRGAGFFARDRNQATESGWFRFAARIGFAPGLLVTNDALGRADFEYRAFPAADGKRYWTQGHGITWK